jgi:hypothetical protein
MIDVRDAELRSAHAARCNVAFARYKLCRISAAEYKAEIESAELERDNARGDMIRKTLRETA